MNYEIDLTQKLIQKKSVTPADDGAIGFLADELEKLGFKCEILEFSKEGHASILNLYAKYGDSDKNLAFAGHTDVVPPGDSSKWQFDPFSATIKDGILYGRGAVDMKTAICSFIAATKEFLEKTPDFNDSISFIITGDEEAEAVNGTVKMVEWLKEKNEKISFCLVGEPTNPSKLGEMVKVGRRGSITFDLKVIGTQGHVAYPENASNPNTALIKLLNLLIDHQFDLGNELFDPTNLEVTTIDVGNPTTNVIPESASAKFNIRFNSEHSSKDIIDLIELACQKTLGKHELNYRVTGESFYNPNKEISALLSDAVKETTGITPKLSTTGGTSDARFIKDICPTIEFGLINQTAHQIDEHIAIEDITKLKDVYLAVLGKFF